MTHAADFVEPDPRRWRALAVLALVSFMLVLDITVVNVALPNIARDLKMSRSGLTWVVDGYVLTAGGLLLLGGRLGDLLGRRRMFLGGVALFAIASALSGAAQNSGLLIASRFLQGVGEAAAAPAAIGLVALLFTDPIERTKALSIFGGVAGLGGTLGPVISGLLIEYASWRWIFFVNIPVAVIAMVAVVRLVDESKADATHHGTRPDFPGAVLVTSGLVGVVYGLIHAADHPWSSVGVVAPLIIGTILLVAFVLTETKVRNPLVPLRFFANRTRVAANVGTLFFASVFFTMFFLLTLYFQDVNGYTPLRSGLAYLPFGIGIGTAIGLCAVLVPKFGIKPVLTVGFLIYAAGIFWLGSISVERSYATHVLPALILMAIGSGFSFAGFQNAALHKVSRADAGLASGVQNAVQQVGGAIGLAVLATIALRHANGEISRGIERNLAAVNGYTLVFHIGAGIMVLGAVMVMLMFEHVEIVPQEELVAASVH